MLLATADRTALQKMCYKTSYKRKETRNDERNASATQRVMKNYNKHSVILDSILSEKYNGMSTNTRLNTELKPTDFHEKKSL